MKKIIQVIILITVGFNLNTAIAQTKKMEKKVYTIFSDDIITIGKEISDTKKSSTIETNNSFLKCSSNEGTKKNSGFPLSIVTSGITTTTEVINRKWEISETNLNNSEIVVSISTTTLKNRLPKLNSTDAYVMLVSDDANFTQNVKTVFLSTSGTNKTARYDFKNNQYFTFGVAHRTTSASHITLDGFDDYIKISDTNELGSTFSLMTWIKPNGQNALGNERTIISKKANNESGYKLMLQNDNRIRMEWAVAGINYATVSNTKIPDAIWHNIAITFGNNILKIYVDGVLDTSNSIVVAPTPSPSIFSIGSQYIDDTSIINHFKGNIDELKLWNVALSQSQIRFMMNQEIIADGNATKGKVLSNLTKNDVSTLAWNSLKSYYTMNSYIGNQLDDDSGNLHRGTLITNKISINTQTAPIPYQSAADGDWATKTTWQNGITQDLPCSKSLVDSGTPIDWNIVEVNNNVISNGNKTILGLLVNSNTFTVLNNSKIEITHYLKLNGSINLVEMSQLVQSLNSDLDPASSGYLQKDQQGQNNIYNYNYWSSPVSTINNVTNNNSFTVAGVMKDGTTTTPQNIVWTGGLNGTPTTPITLSSYWIYKYQNVSTSNANWTTVGQNGILQAGQGYTMKGSGTSNPTQNYTFIGKPNNGLISNPIVANGLNLVGNPYASAIDANAFINDNSASINGTLYFWEHYSTNTSHNFITHQGGYGAKNLVGGVPPIAPAISSGLGSTAKTPGRYIPVGQGFFVSGTATGGMITFNNNQRAFVKENNVNASVMLKNTTQIITASNTFNQNNDDVILVDNFKRVRLGYNDINNYHRQVLLGYMEQNATSGLDNGYDGINFDNNEDDMYFLNSGAKLVIRGDGYFNITDSFPVGIALSAPGTIQFTLDGTENFDDNQNIYIYDNVTGIYHNIKTDIFEINLPAGNIDNRFSLRFLDTTLSVSNSNLENNLTVSFANNNNTLLIKNNQTNIIVNAVEFYNLLGQSIKKVLVENQNQNNILIPVENTSAGTYIARIETNSGILSKKILIK